MCGDGKTERDRYVEEYRPERARGEQLKGDGEQSALNKIQGQGHEHLCDTDMPVRNGNLGNGRQFNNKGFKWATTTGYEK